MGKSVVISDNDCVNALHVTQLKSKERLNGEKYKDQRAALWQPVFSGLRSHLQYVIIFYILLL